MLDRLISDTLLSTREAAQILAVRPRTLEHWRSIGAGPRYSRIGRAVRYSRVAIDKFILDNQSGPAVDYSAALRALGRAW